jgi:hypothetical protein
MNKWESYTSELHHALLELTNPKMRLWRLSMNQTTRPYHCWVNLINWVFEKVIWGSNMNRVRIYRKWNSQLTQMTFYLWQCWVTISFLSIVHNDNQSWRLNITSESSLTQWSRVGVSKIYLQNQTVGLRAIVWSPMD